MNYYNEFDPKAATWLRQLIAEGLIPNGKVDERSITDVQPGDLRGFTQCHFFAGIGGWSLALRLAGWPEDREVWTGSCPCQPFSVAGNGMGEADERHLWPDFRNLIGQCRPAIVFGEQVASAIGRKWLAGVSANLEALAYRFAAADLCAAGVRAPHRRQRLFWLADAEHRNGRGEQQQGEPRADGPGPARGSQTCGMENTDPRGRATGRSIETPCTPNVFAGLASSGTGGLVLTSEPGLEGLAGNGNHGHEPGRDNAQPHGPITETGCVGAWDRFDILPFRDGKFRRVEAGTFPLAHGVSGRVGLLRGYGNAIVPQLAAEFITAYVETVI